MKTVWLILIVVIELICAVYGYKILVVSPSTSFSHFRLCSTLAKGLAEAGHDVTMVGKFDDKVLPKNGKYRNVHLKHMVDGRDEENPNFFEMTKLNTFSEIYFVSSLGNLRTKATLEDPSFKELLRSNNTFDVIILEQFVNDGLKAIACHYNAPLIMFSPIAANFWVNSISGNPGPPSYIPDLFEEYGPYMTFWQRTKNSLLLLFHILNKYFIIYPKQNEMVKQYFPECPDVETLSRNVSLFLLNSHQSFSQPVPLVPNMIDIGGFHVPRPRKLPDDLLNIMDNAKEGVIYFSMGSNIKPSEMEPRYKQALVNALGKLKETVLWKYDEDLAEKSSNIIIRKWLPQMDILAHPNLKLFITHGGLLSTTETLHYGVPILALPVFGDQRLNAAKAVAAGYGLSLNFLDLTEDKFSSTLNELLRNPKYRENARRISRLMHDRPIKPLDLAVYWTEFIVRHDGAPHLRVAAVDMPWYKYASIDVMVTLLSICLGTLTLLYLLVRKVCCRTSNVKIKKN
ncbi:unnamed protein product [Phaedon cochleariae]|uniref:UDP-glucuronosyltransferase n=1 Tax=Phaedon cochleariae TaxID=80249 RepID=A0A9P0DNT5_PHACE|nr:unnamed protein product [Phaedon cochleariae]